MGERVPDAMPGETTTEAERKAVMDRVLPRIIEGFKAEPSHLRGEYITMVATTAISVMHGNYGKEFTRGFLEDAMRSLDDPTTVVLREPTRQ